MNKEHLKFWVSCPDCKRKFGVSPRLVMKYIERVIDQHKHQISGLQELLESAQSQLEREKERKKEP